MARQARSGRQPPWVLLGALVGWVLLIFVSAGPSVDDSLLGVKGLGDVFTGVLLGAALLILVATIFLSPSSRAFTPPPRKRRGRGGIIAVIILGIILWKPSLLDFLRDLDTTMSSPEAADGAGADSAAAQPDETAERETVAQATDILLLLTGLAVTAAVWWLVRSRLAPEPGTDALGAEAGAETAGLARAVSQASVALDAEDDPQMAVIKAYAIVEASLAGLGTPRAASETPREHVQRSLADLRVQSTPLLELADLYELARFAERPMTMVHRERAADLLEQTKRDLASATGDQVNR